MLQSLRQRVAALAIALFLPLPLPPAPALALPGTQVLDNLLTLPQIPLKDLPAVPATPELLEQLRALGNPLEGFNPGDLIPAEQAMQVGQFDDFRMDQMSLRDTAARSGTPIQSVSALDMQELLENINLETLLQTDQLDIGDKLVSQVPAIRDLVVQHVFEQVLTDNMASLDNLGDKIRDIIPIDGLNTGSLTDLISGITDKLPTGAIGSILPADLLQNPQFLPSGFLDSDLITKALGDLKITDLATSLPELATRPLTDLGANVLADLPISKAIPGLDQIPIGNIPGVDSLPLSALQGVNLPSLSLGQMPSPLQWSSSAIIGTLDVALGTPGSGDREQNLASRPVAFVSGGMTRQFNRHKCEGSSCPHFELNSPDPRARGAIWMDSSVRVPDGYGWICPIFPGGCKGPAGAHPAVVPTSLRLLLSKINQAEGTAQASIVFRFCKCKPFIGKSCTPYVFPPGGIPIGVVREDTPIPIPLT